MAISDEVIRKNRQYLTQAQIDALVAAEKQFNNQNAGNRAGALANAREQYDTGYRDLQNMGLAGASGAQPTSGEVPRLEQQIRTPFEDYNNRLRDVERQRLGALGNQFAQQTQAARAAEAERRRQEAYQRAVAAAQSMLSNIKTSITPSYVGPTLTDAEMAARKAQADGLKRTQQVKQQAFENGIGSLLSPVEKAQRDGMLRTARPQDVAAAAAFGKGNATISQQSDRYEKAYKEADATVRGMEMTRRYGGTVNEQDYQAAVQTRNEADTNRILDNYRKNDPEMFSAILTANSSSASSEAKRKAYGVMAGRATTDVVNAMGFQKTMSDKEFNDATKAIPDIRMQLNIIDSTRNRMANGGTGGEKTIEEALTELKKLGYTEDEARDLVEKYNNDRNFMREYDYLNGAYTALYQHQGEKPTKPVNDKETDVTYRVVNRLPNKRSGASIDTETARYMTDEQRDIYNAIFEKEGAAAANEFAKAITPIVEMKRAEDDQQWLEKLATEKGFPAWLLARGANLVGSIPAMVEKLAVNAQNISAGATGELKKYSPNSGTSRLSNWADIVQSKQSQNILEYYDKQEKPGMGKFMNFMYNTGTSMADSLIAMGVSGVLGSGATDALFFSSAGNQAYKDAIQRGATQEQAMGLSFLSGTAEALFEHVSLEKLTQTLKFKGKPLTQAIKDAFTQAGVEGSEELFTEIADVLSDFAIMKDKSEMQEAINNGEMGTYLWDHLSSATLGGLASGFLFGLTGVGGAALSQAKDSKAKSSLGSKVRENSNVQQVKNTAILLGGEAMQQAEKVQDHETDANVGEMTVTVLNEIQSLGGELNQDQQVGLTRVLDGSEMTAEEAKDVHELLGKEMLEKFSYDAATPEAFQKSYNDRLQKHNVTSREETMQKASEERFAKTKQDAAARVWKDPDIGYTITKDGQRIKNMPGNLTAVSLEEQQKNNFAARTTAKAGRTTYQIAGMEAREGLTDEQKISALKKNMDRKQVARAEFIETLADALHVDMVIHDDINGANGYVDSDGTIHFSLSSKQSVLRVASHELTHKIREVSEEHYNAIKDAIIKQVGADTFNKKVEQKKEEYRKAGVKLDQNLAIEETVTEYSEKMLQNTDFLEDFVEENPEAAKTLKGELLKILNAVKRAFKRAENRNYGGSWSNDIKYTQETLQAMYDGLEAVMRDAQNPEKTAKKAEAKSKTVQEETTAQKTVEADDLYMGAEDRQAEQAKKEALESGEKKTHVPGYKSSEVESVISAGMYGDKANYEGSDYETARGMIAQTIPEVTAALEGKADAMDAYDKVRAAVGAMLDNYFEDEGDMTGLREAIPAVIGVDQTAKGDLKYSDQSLFQMSAKLSKALGKRVTLVGETNAKGQKNASYKTAEKLDEVWERVRDQFGLSEDQNFSIDTTKLLDFIEQQADTRKSFSDLYGSQRQEIIEYQSMAIMDAVQDMYEQKTGKKYSLDIDDKRIENTNKQYSKNVVKISDDSELAQLLQNRNGRSPQSIIRQYILSVFGGQSITLSDGRKVIVDHTDARKLSQYPKPRKTAELANIRKIIETAIYDHSDYKPVHNKYGEFHYYDSSVEYNGREYEVELNVGVAKNDGSSHLYDIRDRNKNRTADPSKTDTAKPGNAAGVSLPSGSFNNSMPHSEREVNRQNYRPSIDTDSMRAQREYEQKTDAIYNELTKAREDLRNAEKKRESILESKEYNDAVETVGNAKGDDLDAAIRQYVDFMNRSGANEAQRTIDALQKKVQQLKDRFDKLTGEKAASDREKAIEKSGLSEQDYDRRQALKEFGYTSHFYDAGYLLPNGTMVNFSGEKGKHFGTRGQDHRAIGVIYDDSQGSEAMIRFMNGGNIRVMGETPGIDISNVMEPTPSQYERIRQFARESAGKRFFNVDISDENGNSVGALSYDGRVSPDKVVNDIKHYFATGEIRQQSDVSRFLYSVDTDYMRLAEKYKSGTATEAETQQLQQAVEQAARAAGYNSPKLYHGTDAFGFTEFDLKKSGNMIFATSDPNIASTYSGVENVKSLQDGKIINDVEKATGTKLLDYAKKIIKEKYEDYSLMTDLQKEKEVQKQKSIIEEIKKENSTTPWLDLNWFWDDTHNGDFEDAQQLVKSLADMANAKTLDELDAAHSIFNDLWEKVNKQFTDAILPYLSRMNGYELSYAIERIRIIMRGGDLFTDGESLISDKDLKQEIIREMRHGNIALYGKMGKSLSVDAEYSPWHAIKMPEELKKIGNAKYANTRRIADLAFNLGYDSVEIKNVVDPGWRNDEVDPDGDIYIFKNKSSIKSADPVTYDDNGNVIPLSERFNPEQKDIRYSIDTDAIRDAFTIIDTEGIEDGLEALKGLTPGKGLWALKDISRFLDSVSGGDKNLRNTLHAIFEAPHSDATGRYARNVARMQRKVLGIASRAGVCDENGKHFDSKKSAAIQNIGEGFSNTYTNLKYKVMDADHVTVQAYDPDTKKLVVSEKDYTLDELRHDYGSNVADYVWDQAYRQAEDAQAAGGEKAWQEQMVNTRPYTLADLQKAFPDDWQKLERAANEFREMYDDYIRDQNNMLATIYPIESEYESVDKLAEGIEAKEQRLEKMRTKTSDRIANWEAKFQESLEKQIDENRNVANDRIAKLEERIEAKKAASENRIAELEKKLTAKEKEMAGKRRTDTKAFRDLQDQAFRIRTDIENEKADIAEYQAGVNAKIGAIRDQLIASEKLIKQEIQKRENKKISEIRDQFKEYEKNAKDELKKMNEAKAETENAISHGEGDSLKRMHRLQYRSDYFHHFTELMSGVQNLKAIFKDNTDISPAIVGKSGNTRAKTKWAGYFQQRMGGDYTADAINGMLKYGQLAEYKLAFDPLTAYLRDVEKKIRALGDETNRDNLLRYIGEWTNAIMGKSHTLDRALIDSGLGMRSKLFKTLDWINSRVIQNTLLFNMRSALIQGSNLTNAKGIVRNNMDWANGLRCWALAAKGDEAMASIMAQSNFLASRYMDNLQLTDNKLKKAKEFAGWMLGALDEVSAKATWWAAYTQYTRNPNAKSIQRMGRTYESAVDYADDVTRRTHAGRGIGELAPAMTSRVINLVAPFQVEVNNTWQLLKDNVKQKNYLGLLSTGLSVFLFNTFFEAIVGSTPLGFDFIRAIVDICFGFAGDDPDDEDDNYGVKEIGQRLAGELAGGLPFAGPVVGFVGQDFAKKILGEDTDVTRYGNTQIGLGTVTNTVEGIADIGKAIANKRNLFTQTNFISDIDDLLNLTLPFGGKQLARTAEGIKTVAQGYGSKVNTKGEEQVQFMTGQNILDYLHAGLFGKWALTEASEYFGEKRLLPQVFGAYNGPKSSMGKPVDAKEYKAALQTGIDGRQYFSLKYDLKKYTTQDGKRAEMMEQPFAPEQKAQLDALMIPTAEAKAKGAVVYQKTSDGEWAVKADYTSKEWMDVAELGDKKYNQAKESGVNPKTFLEICEKWKNLSGKDKKDQARAYLQSLNLSKKEYDYIWTYVFNYKTE